MNQEHTLKLLESEKAKKLLGELYGKAAVAENQKRYEDLVGKFVKEFGEKDLYLFSSPGRTEISGNHTDHQHGCVLAAAVNMQTTAEVTLRDDDCIRVASEGYAPVEIRLDDLSIHEDEKNTTAAIVRGVAAAFRQRGCELRGFDASYIDDTRSQIIRQLAARLGCGEAALTDFHARKACGSTQAVGFTFRYQNETYQYDYKNKEMEKING